MRYKSLASGQQSAFASAIRLREAAGLSTGPIPWTTAQLDVSLLSLSTETLTGWMYDDKAAYAGDAVWTDDRAEALNILRTRHPKATLANLVAVSMKRASFRYSTPGVPDLWMPISLPVQRTGRADG